MKVFQDLFAPSRTRVVGQALYTSAARQSRQPAFYARLGVADSAEKRFELLTLHVALLLLRLKGQGEVATVIAQQVFDTFIQALDDALREMGVGDLSVGKKMRKLGEAFYGRAKAYDEAFALAPDVSALQALIGRTVLEDAADPRAGPIAAYAVQALEGLRAQPLPDLLDGRAEWPQAPS